MATIIEAGFTGNAPGTGPAVHEDLSDLLSVVDSKNTPLTSMMPKGRSLAGTATTIHWQADANIEPSTDGWIDGTDVNTASPGTNSDLEDTAANRRVLNNKVQSFKRAFRVAELVDTVVNPAGVRNELAHGISKLILTQKRDLEKTVSSKNDAIEGDATNAFKMKGLCSFLDQDGQSETCGCRVPDGYRVRGGNTAAGSHRSADDATPHAYYSGAKASFTEEKVQDLLEGIYTETGVRANYDVICSPSVKRKFTSFGDMQTKTVTDSSDNQAVAATVVRTLNKDQADKSIVSSIDVYEGDFGTLRLHVSNWLPLDASTRTNSTSGMAYVLDIANLTELRFAKTTNVKPLTDNGGGPGRVVGTIASLVMKNPSAAGRINFSS